MIGDNAVLLEVLGPGTPDRYGDTGDGASVWTGRASGYLKRERRTGQSGGDQVNARRDVFFILDTAGAPVLEAAGPDWSATKVKIEDRRQSPPRIRTFTVNTMEHRQGGAMSSNVRLELDQEK